MKKFFIFVLFFALNINSFAQSSFWTEVAVKGDEMLETSDGTALAYSTDDISILISASAQDARYRAFTMDLKNNIFDYDYTYNTAQIMVGYYDVAGNFLKKETKVAVISKKFRETGVLYEYDLSSVPEKKKASYPVNNDFWDFIDNENGYIRLIIPRYHEVSLDVKIPTLKLCPPHKVN